jgi:hypothetical protein
MSGVNCIRQRKLWAARPADTMDVQYEVTLGLSPSPAEAGTLSFGTLNFGSTPEATGGGFAMAVELRWDQFQNPRWDTLQMSYAIAGGTIDTAGALLNILDLDNNVIATDSASSSSGTLEVTLSPTAQPLRMFASIGAGFDTNDPATIQVTPQFLNA